VQLNGLSGICITKLDVLDGLDIGARRVGYTPSAAARDILPVGAEALAICEPIYEEHPGWKESTVGVKQFEALPKAAQDYLQRLEALVGAPVAIISTGTGPRGDDRPSSPFRLKRPSILSSGLASSRAC
jgi:adenylosuccinate synthase